MFIDNYNVSNFNLSPQQEQFCSLTFSLQMSHNIFQLKGWASCDPHFPPEALFMSQRSARRGADFSNVLVPTSSCLGNDPLICSYCACCQRLLYCQRRGEQQCAGVALNAEAVGLNLCIQVKLQATPLLGWSKP